MFVSKILINKSIHIQSEITGIRFQSNNIFISLLKRLQMIMPSSRKMKRNSNYLIDISLHMKTTTIVVCDSVPGKAKKVLNTRIIEIIFL